MGDLVDIFHIDIKLLVAQAVNFAIVFFVLYYFALKPLLKVMQKRTKTIEKSLKEAEEIEKKLANTEEEYDKKMVVAKIEAGIILEKANQQAEINKGEMVKKAKQEIGDIIKKEKAGVQAEKAKTLKEIKSEIAGLVVASVEKVLEEKMDGEKDKELIKKIVKN